MNHCVERRARRRLAAVAVAYVVGVSLMAQASPVLQGRDNLFAGDLVAIQTGVGAAFGINVAGIVHDV